jgi:hypothetical protein
MRAESLKPAELAKRIRQLAEKRERQASAASDLAARTRLKEVAQNYRALAEEVAREIPLPGARPTADSDQV